jgi:endonuclease/exonuclease/phosphatase family metal-dependent hydrolase
VLYGDHDKNVNRTESAPHRHFQEGVALFYRKDRWELDGEEHGNIWYETKPKEVAPQVVVWGLFHEKTIEGDRTGKSVYVYATHFWPNSGGKRAVPSPLADRETKIVDLMTKIASRKYSDVPVVIGADFNSGEDSPLIRFLKGEEVEIAGQPQKCPVPLVDSLRTVYPFAERKAVASASNSIGRIRLTNNLTSKGRCDYIFVSSSLNPADFRLIKTKTQSGVFPSYHYPQHATLSW